MTENNFGESIRFYSDGASEDKRTGLNVQFTTTRNSELTVSVEVAPIPGVGSAPNWAYKITLQLTRAELVGLCFVLFELKSEVKGSYHGKGRNKGIAAYCNGPKGSAITVSEGGRMLHHLLTPDERLELSVFVLRRLSEAWRVTPSDTIAILRQAARSR